MDGEVGCMAHSCCQAMLFALKKYSNYNYIKNLSAVLSNVKQKFGFAAVVALRTDNIGGYAKTVDKGIRKERFKLKFA
ncbi:unnamed protein product [Haemonchus placei]|uniref:RT_RNaseH_2 domain-containing protein n=1 Tax=Haemonchus placei TaxID=6290 RepID=A0A0N4WTR0_HAEPC|nr:unnamed protein product [Haemonchus placei]